ncbi:MAG: MoaD/ThiS family protein [Dehalococcoidia bacterium]|nr:MoaD/ThiS family protein [Dehalococcoidia bacterium]
MARYTIEIYGVCLPKASSRQVELDLDSEATLGDVLVALAREAPALAGAVLAADGRSLRPPYVMNLNGLDFVDDLGRKPRAGDRILLMAPPAGG